MKNKIIFAGLLVVLIILLGSHQVISTRAGLVPRATTIPLAIGNTKITVEIADTETERTRGLSGRSFLPENTGLLFVFDTTDNHSFWMKEMNFPIDIIWFDDHWRVVDITTNALPKDFPRTYRPRSPVRYVLEVNGGFITAHRITIGTQIVSP